MRLSILIPIYNEVKTLLRVLPRVEGIPMEKEIILVDDGSTDGTRALLAEIERDRKGGRPGSKIRVIFHEKNQGKGAAIRTALANATGEAVAIQDADLEYAPEEIPDLVRCLEETGADVVFGSRFLKDNPAIYRRFLWGNKFLTFFINVLCGGALTDSYTCYKIFRRERFQALNLESSGFEMEAEISAKSILMGYKIEERPVTYSPRTLEEGKKIGWKDALRGIKMAFRVRRRLGPKGKN